MGREWTTTEGQIFKVICPGYSGLSWGPDFRRAVIFKQGRKVKGDIEFHVHSREWVEHGHHRDLAYDRVILHIVWEDDMPGPTLTSVGCKVPVFVANGFLQDNCNVSLPCCDTGLASSPELLRNLLAQQGKLRFLCKALLTYRAFENIETEEALYQGIFQAMGYSENKDPFLKLACLVPFRILQRRASSLNKEERLDYIQKLYLVSSGIFPEEHRLSGILSSNPASYFGTALITRTGLKRSDWKFYGLRPANHPVRRLMAASSLIARNLDKGLVNGLALNISGLKDGELYPHKRLMVEDSMESSNTHLKASLLGRSRALLMLVNVILPFAYALGKKENNDMLFRRSLDLFRRCPSTGENIVIRHFRHLWGLRLKLNAQEEQGLLRLENFFCSQGKCNQCPLNIKD